jgi:hypothetical protein
VGLSVKNLLLLLTAVVVSLLGAELATRAAGFTPRVVAVNPFFKPDLNTTWSIPDPELGWINKPGVAQAIGEDPAPMTFWDFGRRATRPDSAIPPGDHIPVMVVGGSDAQAYGVRDEDSFIALLAQRYPNLWFENFGGGGYGTVQAMLMAERAYDKFYGANKPRLLLLTFSDTHAARNVSDQSWVYSISDSEGRRISPPHYRQAGGDLEFHPFRVIKDWPLEKRSAVLSLLHDRWLRSVAYNTNDQAVPVTRRVLQQLAGFAAQRNMEFAAVITEDYTEVGGSVFAGQPFPYKDCSGQERTNHAATHLAGNNHPNKELHVILADCIAAWLDAEVLPKLAKP